jgi:hypothetical protein
MADEQENPPSAMAQMPRVRRRAPTIDLKATEVAVEPPPSVAADSAAAAAEADSAAPPEYPTEPPAYETGGDAPPHDASPPHEPPPPPPPQHAARRFPYRRVIAAGVTGGLAALIVVAALWLLGMVGATDSSSDRRLAAMETQLRQIANSPAPANADAGAIGDLTARLARLENAAPRADVNAAAGSSLEQAIKPLQTTVADLARRTEDNAAALREARGQADAAREAANAARAAVERNNVEALGNRVAALEGASKTLSDEVTKSLAAAGDRPLRAAVAAQALRTAVERGDPFAAELSAAKALAADPNTLAPLEPFAASGLPSAAVLARRLSDIAPAILKNAAAPTPAGGFLDRLQANAEKLVRIRPVDEAPGDEPAAVVSRAQAKAARSDLAGAVTELNALPQQVRAPAEDWIKQVEARNAAVNASRRLAADAMTALGKASP